MGPGVFGFNNQPSDPQSNRGGSLSQFQKNKSRTLFSNFNTCLNHLEGLLQQFTGSTFRVSDSGNVGWGLRICISNEWPDDAVPGRPHVENHFDLLENHRRYQLYFNFKKERKKLQREKRGRQMIIWVSPYVSNFCGNLFFLVLINIFWGQDELGIWGQQMQTIIYRINKKKQGPFGTFHKELDSISYDKL